MVRATFANPRLRNAIAGGVEGGWTRHWPSGRQLRLFDAATLYAADRTPLLVLAGKNYGCGSSRDWAAKGQFLLGVRAVLAENFARIHRGNLIGVGILPLQFRACDAAASLGLVGDETFDFDRADDLMTGEPIPHSLRIPRGIRTQRSANSTQWFDWIRRMRSNCSVTVDICRGRFGE